ncbi:MAG TPA: 23S rRNA (pseudouridine(1915)-N(3))-methyltransferase RlmH [Thermoanaerobaculia bacterium]|nr:23S rRNA (pseudouridine(1915)-N(3))-methyltransferase RlmH [Thermoanaerobaculia bacterium]
MARELLVVWAGRHQRSSWEELCAGYRRRIARLAPVRDLPVRARGGADDPQRLRAEGEALLAALPDPCWPVALDPLGEALDSPALARRLARLREEWPHPVAFLIGSDLGLDPAVVAGARWRLSLGPLTLSHELARLVLYEQLFRSLSIEAGLSYHRALV